MELDYPKALEERGALSALGSSCSYDPIRQLTGGLKRVTTHKLGIVALQTGGKRRPQGREMGMGVSAGGGKERGDAATGAAPMPVRKHTHDTPTQK